jgi:hypothetical protein
VNWKQAFWGLTFGACLTSKFVFQRFEKDVRLTLLHFVWGTEPAAKS